MTDIKELKDKLFYNRENAWESKEDEQLQDVFAYADGYIRFLNKSKTEREIIESSEEIAKANGFKSICEYETLNPGDKVYYINREKSMYLAIIGKENIEKGQPLFWENF